MYTIATFTYASVSPLGRTCSTEPKSFWNPFFAFSQHISLQMLRPRPGLLCIEAWIHPRKIFGVGVSRCWFEWFLCKVHALSYTIFVDHVREMLCRSRVRASSDVECFTTCFGICSPYKRRSTKMGVQDERFSTSYNLNWLTKILRCAEFRSCTVR